MVEMCQRCGCCSFQNGKCDGDDGHYERVTRLKPLDDAAMWREIEKEYLRYRTTGIVNEHRAANFMYDAMCSRGYSA